LYLVLISIERFVVEFLRVNPRYALSLSEAQWIALALAFAGLVLVGLRTIAGAPREGAA
jgi:prolipoprotein diacylglyceryltransferase